MSKESQDACHDGCPIRFRLDAFERKAQYKSAVVSFVSDTCALIAGDVRAGDVDTSIISHVTMEKLIKVCGSSVWQRRTVWT